MRNVKEWHEEPYVHGAGGLVADNLEQWSENIGIPSNLARKRLFYTYGFEHPLFYNRSSPKLWRHLFSPAFKFGRRVHFALRRKMLQSPIARLPAILLDFINLAEYRGCTPNK